MAKSQGIGTEPIHLICRLQWDRLRAWKKRSLREEVSEDGRIRPQAFSSSSSSFRGILDDWAKSRTKQPVTLWILTSFRLPGRRLMVPSLAAKVQLLDVHRGDDEGLDPEWKRYVRNWSSSKKESRPELCRIVEADRTNSRFFPANDITPCLNELQFVRRDRCKTKYSPRSVIRIHPGKVQLVEDYAKNISHRTVFISYKHCDFEDGEDVTRPPWGMKELAEAFISNRFGIWLDALCIPRRAQSGKEELSRKAVRLLLAEGHAQSGVVVGLNTGNFLQPGSDRQNWTQAEYDGAVSKAQRHQPLRRLILCEDPKVKTKLKPEPDKSVGWSQDLRTEIVPSAESLFPRQG